MAPKVVSSGEVMALVRRCIQAFYVFRFGIGLWDSMIPTEKTMHSTRTTFTFTCAFRRFIGEGGGLVEGMGMLES